MIFPVMAFYRLPKQWGNDRRATCAGVGCFLFTRPDSPEWAERVGKYMLRPVLALERLTFLEPEGKVGYRWGRDGAGQETEVMDYLEFIARVTSHIPDKRRGFLPLLDLRARFSQLLTSPPGRGYSSTMDWGANSMSGGGIQPARKKQILILKTWR
jgi:hypothetical protein